jgi:hypothetical protein
MRIPGNPLALLLRPRVQHSLPGRLRVHMPLLQRLPQDKPELVAIIADILALPDGITTAEPAPETGNVLVHYDEALIREEDVLAYLRSVTHLAVSNQKRLLQASEADLERIHLKLTAWLRAQLAYRPELDGSARIPDDVMA